MLHTQHPAPNDSGCAQQHTQAYKIGMVAGSLRFRQFPRADALIAPPPDKAPGFGSINHCPSTFFSQRPGATARRASASSAHVCQDISTGQSSGSSSSLTEWYVY